MLTEGGGRQFIPFDQIKVAPHVSQPERNKTEADDFRAFAEDAYIVPSASAVNSQRIARIVARWINDEPENKINHQSEEWIREKWAAGHGIMLLVHEEGKEPVDIFGQEDLDDETIEKYMLSAAFIKPLEKPIDQEAELGTVITNKAYRSHPERRMRSLGGGKLAFQAVQDLAHKVLPNARLFTWVHDGSAISVRAAFDGRLKAYTIDRSEEPERFSAIFGVCEKTCKNFDAKKGQCCHSGYEVPNEQLHLIQQRPLQAE